MTLIILLIHFIVLLVWQSAIASAAEHGFTLELIHRDSVDSPLYPGNLTELERIQRLVRFSEPDYVIEPGSLRPIVTADRRAYMVKVAIGSNHVALHFLISLTTGLSWTQCAPCNPCIPQEGPMFTPDASSTFLPIPGSHPSCMPPEFHPRGDTCEFVYADEGNTQVTKGIVARETFTFASSVPGRTEPVPGVLFGCAHHLRRPTEGHNRLIGGQLGLNPSPESFGAQIAAHTGTRFAFSYCLVDAPSRRISYLHFGKGMRMRRSSNKVTQLFLRDGVLNYYYVKLLDISVGGRRLHLPPGSFRIPGATDNFEGCALDIAQWVTLLARPVYAAVRTALVAYFSRYPQLTITGGADMGGLDLCYHYERRIAYRELPTMEYHFPENSLEVAGRHSVAFHPNRQEFCVLMKPTRGVTIIGSAQQQNTRFGFDVSNKQLYFTAADCTHHVVRSHDDEIILRT